MRTNLMAGGLLACGAVCVGLLIIPGFTYASTACALGVAAAAGGLLLWKAEPKTMEA